MKKWLVLIVSFLLLSGCSLLEDYYNAGQLGDEMQKVIDSRNVRVPVVEDVINIHDEVIKELNAMTEADQTTLQDLSKKVNDAKKSLQDYKDEEKKILDQLPDLLTKSSQLEKPNIRTLADNFINDFKYGIEKELEYLAAVDKMLDTDLTAISDLQNGKENDADSQNNAIDEVNRLVPISDQAIDKFNQSWEKFHKSVTGNKVQ